MGTTVFDFALPLFRQTLTGLQIILDKTDAHVRAAHQSPDGLLEARLQADMLPLAFQIGQSVDWSAGALKLVLGEAYKGYYVFDSFDAARAAVAEGVAFLDALDPAAFAGLEEKEVVWIAPKIELRYQATRFITGSAVPNFYFHATTAYSTLRLLGVPIGKFNFLGREAPQGWKGPGGTAKAALDAMAARGAP
jgi:hypothetical protein